METRRCYVVEYIQTAVVPVWARFLSVSSVGISLYGRRRGTANPSDHHHLLDIQPDKVTRLTAGVEGKARPDGPLFGIFHVKTPLPTAFYVKIGRPKEVIKGGVVGRLENGNGMEIQG